MLKIVFNDGTKSLASFGLVSENIVSLNGAEQNTSGFKAYREKDDMFLGDYSDYTTVYKTDGENIFYSNDGSVYVEPEYPEIEDIPFAPKDDAELAEEEMLARMSLEQRVTECEDCILELSSIVYAE